MSSLRNYIVLSKIKIILPVSLTGFTGYFLCYPRLTYSSLLVTAGIMFLSASASVINQLQEIRTDRMMERTRYRPLPEGSISPAGAMIFAALMMSGGSLLLFRYGNTAALLTGLFAILWYNGVYTYLKKITAFAVFPGALTGAIPPVIGWVAAGCSIFDRTILMVAFLFFMGQMPHFWLIVLKYGEEYSKAGLPTIVSALSRQQTGRLIFIWIAASAIASVFLLISGVVRTPLTGSVILLAAVAIVWNCRSLLNPGDSDNYSRYRMLLNTWFLMIMILLVSDSLLRYRI